MNATNTQKLKAITGVQKIFLDITALVSDLSLNATEGMELCFIEVGDAFFTTLRANALLFPPAERGHLS